MSNMTFTFADLDLAKVGVRGTVQLPSRPPAVVVNRKNIDSFNMYSLLDPGLHFINLDTPLKLGVQVWIVC